MSSWKEKIQRSATHRAGRERERESCWIADSPIRLRATEGFPDAAAARRREWVFSCRTPRERERAIASECESESCVLRSDRVPGKSKKAYFTVSVLHRNSKTLPPKKWWVWFGIWCMCVRKRCAYYLQGAEKECVRDLEREWWVLRRRIHQTREREIYIYHIYLYSCLRVSRFAFLSPNSFSMDRKLVVSFIS